MMNSSSILNYFGKNHESLISQIDFLLTCSTPEAAEELQQIKATINERLLSLYRLNIQNASTLESQRKTLIVTYTEALNKIDKQTTALAKKQLQFVVEPVAYIITQRPSSFPHGDLTIKYSIQINHTTAYLPKQLSRGECILEAFKALKKNNLTEAKEYINGLYAGNISDHLKYLWFLFIYCKAFPNNTDWKHCLQETRQRLNNSPPPHFACDEVIPDSFDELCHFLGQALGGAVLMLRHPDFSFYESFASIEKRQSARYSFLIGALSYLLRPEIPEQLSRLEELLSFFERLLDPMTLQQIENNLSKEKLSFFLISTFSKATVEPNPTQILCSINKILGRFSLSLKLRLLTEGILNLSSQKKHEVLHLYMSNMRKYYSLEETFSVFLHSFNIFLLYPREYADGFLSHITCEEHLIILRENTTYCIQNQQNPQALIHWLQHLDCYPYPFLAYFTSYTHAPLLAQTQTLTFVKNLSINSEIKKAFIAHEFLEKKEMIENIDARNHFLLSMNTSLQHGIDAVFQHLAVYQPDRIQQIFNYLTENHLERDTLLNGIYSAWLYLQDNGRLDLALQLLIPLHSWESIEDLTYNIERSVAVLSLEELLPFFNELRLSLNFRKSLTLGIINAKAVSRNWHELQPLVETSLNLFPSNQAKEKFLWDILEDFKGQLEIGSNLINASPEKIAHLKIFQDHLQKVAKNQNLNLFFLK